ncbi:hypothetical protein CPAR01_03948 [Colletotrichum paranaense]|uniref:Uncharacterized protein n=2 Tax=Colletotrichum acutatum species complex TaxID=2707335 RepID=A0AAI9V221_9PEZI|nr:uncharacterized protein CPAR01_03948 [Colletotrichum paranaense]XP_060398422.1 uncharacterized protein CABS01_01854 [Colletotrichum abscissum]KAK1469058.1 hypothetical protein CMEL01_00825 [Colletotrichum melonis]KAK1496047.1 hypothetical protein CABS01_01854 [Colletotrichum abscissum]KAK1543315.1 hypothetical protein CPAR01_03948 [Colletotrichum paranaense]
MTVNSIRCRPLLLDLARTSRSIAQGTSHGCLCLLFSRLRSHVLSRSWLTLISRHCRVQTYFAAYNGSRIIPSSLYTQAFRQGNATKLSGQGTGTNPSCQLKGNC